MAIIIFRPIPIYWGNAEPIPYLMLEFDTGDRYGEQYLKKWYNKY